MEYPDNKKLKISLFEIDDILSGNNPDYPIPENLKPNSVHIRYHSLKDHLNYFGTLKKWEYKISAEIAKEFRNYTLDNKEKPNINLAFCPSRGWIVDENGTTKVPENQLKYIEICNHYRLISHYWLLNSGKLDLSKYIDLLYKAGCPREIADEMKFIYPGCFRMGEYRAKDKFVIDQLPKIINQKYLDINELLSTVKVGEKVDVIKFKNERIKSGTRILEQIPTIQFKNVAEYETEMELIFPFINRTRLILYFWLEQDKPAMTTQMIEALLFQSPNIIDAGQKIFYAWFYEVAKYVHENKRSSFEGKKQREKIINLIRDIVLKTTGTEMYRETQVRDNWKIFKNDADAAKIYVKKLITINDKLPKNHPVKRIIKSRVLRKMFQF